jgi:hypothetical protein
MKKMIFFTFLAYNSILLAQSNEIIKPIEGIFFFSNEHMHGSLPQDAIFIPFDVNENKTVQENLADCLHNTNKGYFIYFNLMGITQPYNYNYAVSPSDSANTDKWITSANITYAYKSSKNIALKSVDFPVAGGQLGGESDISVKVGKIVCRELTIRDRELDSLAIACMPLSKKPNNQKKNDFIFCVNFEGKEYTLISKRYNRFEYQLLAFVPLKD